MKNKSYVWLGYGLTAKVHDSYHSDKTKANRKEQLNNLKELKRKYTH